MKMEQQEKITVNLVGERERMSFLPRLFKNYFMRCENHVYQLAGKLSENYQGGTWEFAEASNGALYMRPEAEEDEKFSVSSENYYSGELSADAFGILCTFLTVNNMCWMLADENAPQEKLKHFIDMNYLIRDVLLEHQEKHELIPAID